MEEAPKLPSSGAFSKPKTDEDGEKLPENEGKAPVPVIRGHPRSTSNDEDDDDDDDDEFFDAAAGGAAEVYVPPSMTEASPSLEVSAPEHGEKVLEKEVEKVEIREKAKEHEEGTIESSVTSLEDPMETGFDAEGRVLMKDKDTGRKYLMDPATGEVFEYVAEPAAGTVPGSAAVDFYAKHDTFLGIGSAARSPERSDAVGEGASDDESEGGGGRFGMFGRLFRRGGGGGGGGGRRKSVEEKGGDGEEKGSHRKRGGDGGGFIRVGVHRKDLMEMTRLRELQTLASGEPVWTMRFSPDGRFLAAAGGGDAGAVVRLWRVVALADTPLEAPGGSREDLGGAIAGSRTSSTHTPASVASQMQEDGEKHEDEEDDEATIAVGAAREPVPSSTEETTSEETESRSCALLEKEPFRELRGHGSHVVDLAWSRSLLLLTASMDGCVRLWHPARSECLHKFHHPDAVTSVSFNPGDDRYFLTGCFDEKLRVWSLETGRVVLWHSCATLVTSVAFSPDAQYAVAGLWNGLVVFYHADGLRYHTVVEARNRSGAMRKGRKVTGLEFINGGTHLLVTTNDSRARLISIDDFSQEFKYIGPSNISMQIRATFDSTGDRIICGSEDGLVYLWRTRHDMYTPAVNPKFTGFKRHKVRSYEWFSPPPLQDSNSQIPASTAVVFAPISTTAAFAMNRATAIRAAAAASTSSSSAAAKPPPSYDPDDEDHVHIILVVGDAVGNIRIFESDGPIERV